MVTLNPARQLGIDNRVGSIEVGKDADLVIYDKYPLSDYRQGAEGADRRHGVLRPRQGGSARRPPKKREKQRLIDKEKHEQATEGGRGGRGGRAQ